MDEHRLSNVNVASQNVLLSPADLKLLLPLSESAEQTVFEARHTVENILARRDPRLILVAGPCSIHDPAAALDYAARLRRLADEVKDSIFIIMRVYFEKPRTTTGWKGLINDPEMDDTFDIEQGLQVARKLLLAIAEMKLPAGTEALDPITPQYLSDLIAWNAIGARTTESQTHREMASGLSAPVGFKNGTDGGLQVAINALLAASKPHTFLGINQSGQVTTLRTKGNGNGHIILRGGTTPNYDSVAVALAEQELAKHKLAANIMIDCSHGNSNKNAALQPLVLHDVVNQIVDGNRSIIGFMLESNLEAGNQPIPADLSKLKYGVSVTDACIDWTTTERALREASEKLAPVMLKRQKSS
jgi:3-deoxy-7-phosphoheptulonate synthase